MKIGRQYRLFTPIVSILFVVLTLLSSLELGIVQALGAVHPGGELVPRTHSLFRRANVNPLLTPDEALIGGKVNNGFTKLESGLVLRAPYCDDGYGLCRKDNICCTLDSQCCGNGGCCDQAHICCSFKGCCKKGYYCTVVDGDEGCCPNGEICTGNSGACADDGYVKCKNYNFCCKPGYKCALDSQGEPICESPGDDSDDATSTSRTTRRIVTTTTKTTIVTAETTIIEDESTDAAEATGTSNGLTLSDDFQATTAPTSTTSRSRTTSTSATLGNSGNTSNFNSSCRLLELSQALLLWSLIATIYVIL